jgi:hypothetical protein
MITTKLIQDTPKILRSINVIINMRVVATNGFQTEEINSNEIILFTKMTVNTTEKVIRAETTATPVVPHKKIPIGVNIHVKTVQKIMSINVVLTCPIASSTLTKIFDNEEIVALRQKK